jgi:hypothetical protein
MNTYVISDCSFYKSKAALTPGAFVPVFQQQKLVAVLKGLLVKKTTIL